MTLQVLIWWSVGLYVVRVVPAVLFLALYRVASDPMADFLRVVMLAIILAVAPQIVYLFNPALIAQLGHIRVPWPLAALSLFREVIWCAVAWWLFVIWRRYR